MRVGCGDDVAHLSCFISRMNHVATTAGRGDDHNGEATWKDFLWPYIVLTDPSKQPIIVGLYRNFAQQTFFPVNTEMAALTIASVPPIILFLVFQRQIIRGIALTGLTGS